MYSKPRKPSSLLLSYFCAMLHMSYHSEFEMNHFLTALAKKENTNPEKKTEPFVYRLEIPDPWLSPPQQAVKIKTPVIEV